MSLQKQIEHLHKQLSRACECDHVLFISDEGNPLAIPMTKFVGVYRAPELEDLQGDILEAVKRR